MTPITIASGTSYLLTCDFPFQSQIFKAGTLLTDVELVAALALADAPLVVYDGADPQMVSLLAGLLAARASDAGVDTSAWFSASAIRKASEGAPLKEVSSSDPQGVAGMNIVVPEDGPVSLYMPDFSDTEKPRMVGAKVWWGCANLISDVTLEGDTISIFPGTESLTGVIFAEYTLAAFYGGAPGKYSYVWMRTAVVVAG